MRRKRGLEKYMRLTNKLHWVLLASKAVIKEPVSSNRVEIIWTVYVM